MAGHRRVHGHILLEHEGCVDRARQVRAHRALARAGAEPRLVVTARYTPQLARWLEALDGPWFPRVVDTWSGLEGAAEMDQWLPGLALPYLPGVSFESLVAQTHEQDARVPHEAVAVLLADVLRASHALRAVDVPPALQVDPPELEPVSTAHVRIGFDGSVHVLPIPVYNDMRDIIGAGSFGPGLRRTSELGLPFSPRTALGEPTPPAEELAFCWGSLLYISLGGRYPSGENPLEFLQALVREPVAAAPRGTPDALRAVYERATSSMATTWEDLLDLADQLEAFAGDEGRPALGGCVSGLFPSTRAQQLAFLDEAAFMEFTDADDGVPAPQPRTLPNRRHPVLNAPHLEVDVWLVTHGDFARFLEATHHPRPASFLDIAELADHPVILVSQADAAAYAAWRGGRLPTEAEWVAIAATPYIGEIGRLWEWTATTFHEGHVVRGGPWRDMNGPGNADHRSWEIEPAPDVGFRCVYPSGGTA